MPPLDVRIAAWRERGEGRRAEAPPTAPGPPPLALRLARAGVPPAYLACTLDSFAELVAGDRPKADALRTARAWDGRRSLVIAGAAAGAGKTGLATSLLRQRLAAGCDARWVRAGDYLSALRQRQRSESPDGSAEAFAARCASLALLLIDDLGAERPTEFATEQLTSLIDRRLTWGRVTLITTNLPNPEALADSYGAALASRLRDQLRCDWISLEGADLRAAASTGPHP